MEYTASTEVAKAWSVLLRSKVTQIGIIKSDEYCLARATKEQGVIGAERTTEGKISKM